MNTLEHATESVLVPGEGEMARHERIINHFAKVTQFLTWPILFPLFHILFRLDINGREHFKDIRAPFIVVANHVNFYDSFLFRVILGLFTPHLPLRFMAVTEFDWKFLKFLSSIGVIKFIYSLFGVFTVIPGRGLIKNLEEAEEILRVGGNIVIYPEGSIILPTDEKMPSDSIGEFKKGASVLMKRTGVPVVPVSFKVVHKFLRKTIVVNIGKPIRTPIGLDYSGITAALRDRVVQLHRM